MFYSCEAKHGQTSESRQEDSVQNINVGTKDIEKKVRPKYRTIKEVLAYTNTPRSWMSKNYYPVFWFSYQRDTMNIQFDGQCVYDYPAKIKENKIIAYWDFIEDCTHSIGIKKNFGLKHHPVVGKPFMTLELINDSTLKADYLYPEWTKKFNSLTDYAYLPDTVYSIEH
jgi:hypothetical protein